MLLILHCILLSQQTLMGICNLLLVKNCMKLVSSKFSEKFALNQLLIFVNIPFRSFIKLVGFGLVMIRIVFSTNTTKLD
jgi:hypothetical protein